MRLFRRRRHRAELLLQHRHEILHAVHILFRAPQLAEAFFLPHPVPADACHLFENQPPFLRPRGQHLIHPVLSDDGQ